MIYIDSATTVYDLSATKEAVVFGRKPDSATASTWIFPVTVLEMSSTDTTDERPLVLFSNLQLFVLAPSAAPDIYLAVKRSQALRGISVTGFGDSIADRHRSAAGSAIRELRTILAQANVPLEDGPSRFAALADRELIGKYLTEIYGDGGDRQLTPVKLPVHNWCGLEDKRI